MPSGESTPAGCLFLKEDARPEGRAGPTEGRMDDQDLISADFDALWMNFWPMGW